MINPWIFFQVIGTVNYLLVMLIHTQIFDGKRSKDGPLKLSEVLGEEVLYGSSCILKFVGSGFSSVNMKPFFYDHCYFSMSISSEINLFVHF